MSATFRSSSSVSKPSQLSPFQQKQKMSLAQTYRLAHSARAKLSKEAGQADHDLRLLVGHANLLDGLMVDLAEAEQEQESWFNQTVAKASSAPKHIQWSDSIPASTSEDAYDDEAEDSDDSSESELDSDDEESFYATASPLQRHKSPPMITINTQEIMLEEDEEEDEEHDSELQLTRTPSRSSPPELLHETSDSDSDDDSMPASPPTASIALDAFSEQQRQVSMEGKSQSIAMPGGATSQEEAFYEEGFYLPQRQIAAY